MIVLNLSRRRRARLRGAAAAAALMALAIGVLAGSPNADALGAALRTAHAPSPNPMTLGAPQTAWPAARNPARVAIAVQNGGAAAAGAADGAPAGAQTSVAAGPTPEQEPSEDRAADAAPALDPAVSRGAARAAEEDAADIASAAPSVAVGQLAAPGPVMARLTTRPPAMGDAVSLADRAGGEGGLPREPWSGSVGYVLADVGAETILERRGFDEAFIPASVAKVPTALYALETLGAEHRFVTALFATGAVTGGVLEGDLYLVGSGDPTLDTDDLAALRDALSALGVTEIAGRFIYDDRALPTAPQIEPKQPIHAAYNPSVSGLNLNFNRALFRWERQRDGSYAIEMQAHAARSVVPAVTVRAGLTRADERALYGYSRLGGGAGEALEEWRVAKRILGRRGSRWFPVQLPAIYAAETFRSLAAEEEIALPAPERGALPTAGAHPIAVHQSEPLEKILRGMLRYSTNITAEAVGMAASAARGVEDLSFLASGRAMSAWTAERYGLSGAGETAALANHSGLSAASRMTPQAMARVLVGAATGPEGDFFRELMPRHRLKGLTSRAVVRAKTGTIYFGRALAGYISCQNGGEYAFAFFNSDIDARDAYDATIDPTSTAPPRGGRSFLSRAREVERGLLRRWASERCG